MQRRMRSSRLAAISGVVFYIDTSCVFFREVSAVPRVLPKHATARWGVVQLVGHLTVNEDGEGSNPSAPANFPSKNRCASVVRRFNTVCTTHFRVFPEIATIHSKRGHVCHAKRRFRCINSSRPRTAFAILT